MVVVVIAVVVVVVAVIVVVEMAVSSSGGGPLPALIGRSFFSDATPRVELFSFIFSFSSSSSSFAAVFSPPTQRVLLFDRLLLIHLS